MGALASMAAKLCSPGAAPLVSTGSMVCCSTVEESDDSSSEGSKGSRPLLRDRVDFFSLPKIGA
jgi:hypothetical protein